MFLSTSHERTMAWALILLLAFPVALPFLGVTEAGPSGRALEKRDWTVVGNETVKNQTVRLTGNLTIGPGAKLTLTNSTLELNMSKDHEFHITVKDGGRFVLVDSVVRSTAPGRRYKLDVTNASIESDRTYIENFTSVSIAQSKAVLDNTALMDNNGTALAVTSSDVSMAGCIITMRSVGDALRLSDSTLDVWDSTFQTNRGSGNTGINITGGSTVTILKGGIYNFSTGIEFKGSSMDLDNLRITGSGDNGIKQLAGTSQITHSMFDENLQSIESLGGSMNITMSDIRGRGFGIILEDCTAHVGHNTVRSSGMGMFVVNSSAFITDNVFKDNTMGLKMLNTKNGSIEGNVFENNSQAALFEVSTVIVTDCEFSSTTTDLGLTGSTVTTVNSTFKKEIIDQQSTLIVEWYLDIKVVTYDKKPAPGATVKMHDVLGRHLDRTTTYDGWARNIIVRQSTRTRYGTTYNSPYTIEAQYKSAQASKTINITMSEAITITVYDIDLYIKDLSVSNLTTNMNKPVYINVTLASTFYPIKGVGLMVTEDGMVYSDDLHDMPTEVVVLLKYIPSKPGSHYISIILDPHHNINETDLNNNKRNITINAVAGAEDLPDLRPIGITPDTTSLQQGNSIPVTVDIENTGNIDATNVVVQLFADSKKVGENTIPMVSAGSMKPTVFSWSASTGQYTLRVVVDPYDQVKESNENNNELSTPVDLSSSNPNSLVNDALALMCISILVIIVVVIVVIIYAMVRRSKPSSSQQYSYQYQYGQQYQYQPQYTYPAGGTYAPTQGTGYSSGPQPVAQVSPSSDQATPATPSGKNMCPRCRGTKIRNFDDGHKLCERCRKIFF
jgi:hypothetical protein